LVEGFFHKITLPTAEKFVTCPPSIASCIENRDGRVDGGTMGSINEENAENNLFSSLKS